MTIIVLGSSGQLASHLKRAIPGALCWGRDTLDIGNAATLHDALVAARPRCIVNAAAYTAVDKAEAEPDAAWRLNAEAPAAAARAAAAVGAAIVQVSTDYVFDGRASDPYPEHAAVNPLNVYGASKLAGELAVRTLCPRHWILRTSWVFSEHGANFVKTVLRLAAGDSSLRIVADQHGTPTYAGDLARLVAALVAAAPEATVPCGTYHATGGRAVSWHEFALSIVARAHARGLLATAPPVHAITTRDYPTPAARPRHSVLEPSVGLQALAGFDWEAGLENMLTALTAGIGAART